MDIFGTFPAAQSGRSFPNGKIDAIFHSCKDGNQDKDKKPSLQYILCISKEMSWQW